jgi:hypothetical protein
MVLIPMGPTDKRRRDPGGLCGATKDVTLVASWGRRGNLRVTSSLIGLAAREPQGHVFAHRFGGERYLPEEAETRGHGPLADLRAVCLAHFGD